MIEPPGKVLKKERETRNLSLEDVSKFSKVKEHHLKALEEDRYELLPPAIYIKGYLNIYAKYLALDPKDIILQYENYLKSLTPPDPAGTSKPETVHKKNLFQSLPFFSAR